MSDLLARLSARFEQFRPTTLRNRELGDFIKHPQGLPAGPERAEIPLREHSAGLIIVAHFDNQLSTG